MSSSKPQAATSADPLYRAMLEDGIVREGDEEQAQDGPFVEIHLVFDPAIVHHLVEIVTFDGRSIQAGTWLERDGRRVLALTVHRADIRQPQELPR